MKLDSCIVKTKSLQNLCWKVGNGKISKGTSQLLDFPTTCKPKFWPEDGCEISGRKTINNVPMNDGPCFKNDFDSLWAKRGIAQISLCLIQVCLILINDTTAML